MSRFITALLRLTDRMIGERAERVTALVKIAIKQLDLERPWEFEVAARLSQIGYASAVNWIASSGAGCP